MNTQCLPDNGQLELECQGLDRRLYDRMTMKDLIRTMEKLRTQVIDDRRILFPLTKKQREIYEAFGLSLPVQV